MNFFAEIGRKRAGDRQAMHRFEYTGADTCIQDRAADLDLNIWNAVLSYTDHLTLPAQNGTAKIEAAAGRGGRSYLLFFTDGTEAGSMNAGYLAGQSVSYLRFLGVNAEIVRIMPDGVSLPSLKNGLQFAASLTAKEAAGVQSGANGKVQTELGCIYTETRENWSDELLDFAKARYPQIFRRIQADRREHWIHFAAKKAGRRRASEDAFKAGMDAAVIMAAAEELWVDLELIKLEKERISKEMGRADVGRVSSAEDMRDSYLFSVRRKGDKKISYV